jgi:hypothetical protein
MTMHDARTLKVFEPAVTQAMAAALDQAWQELQAQSHVCAAPFGAAATREKLAVKILELPEEGEDDLTILKDYALA